jgi:hypothetical protein
VDASQVELPEAVAPESVSSPIDLFPAFLNTIRQSKNDLYAFGFLRHASFFFAILSVPYIARQNHESRGMDNRSNVSFIPLGGPSVVLVHLRAEEREANTPRRMPGLHGGRKRAF